MPLKTFFIIKKYEILSKKRGDSKLHNTRYYSILRKETVNKNVQPSLPSLSVVCHIYGSHNPFCNFCSQEKRKKKNFNWYNLYFIFIFFLNLLSDVYIHRKYLKSVLCTLKLTPVLKTLQLNPKWNMEVVYFFHSMFHKPTCLLNLWHCENTDRMIKLFCSQLR